MINQSSSETTSYDIFDPTSYFIAVGETNDGAMSVAPADDPVSFADTIMFFLPPDPGTPCNPILCGGLGLMQEKFYKSFSVI